ncbi:MAG: alkaline phosphatase family protein [Deltaproteobacteria bacterium]|nr:alkaline phosphatase family protein [Deltaproteobacteria bacterium]
MLIAVGVLVACLEPASPSAGRGKARRASTSAILAASAASRARGPLQLSLAPSPPPRAADRVVVVSVDGLRPDAISSRTRTLRHLRTHGATAVRADTIESSSTLPSHASMVSGVDVDQHGMDFNGWRPGRGRIRAPSIFSIARQSGLSTSLVVAKRKLEHLVHEGDAELFRTGGMFCQRVNSIALPHLGEAGDGVHFVHYSDVDAAGHRFGWMSREYLRAVRRVDRCLGRLIEALHARGDLERTLVVITADHGGHGRSHGSARGVDRRIPWIAFGGPAEHGARIDHVDTQDTAATVLEALGLPRPPSMDGRPVLAALSRR